MFFLAEYVSLASVLALGSPMEKIELLYEFFDLDGDGFVTSHDVFAAVRLGLMMESSSGDFEGGGFNGAQAPLAHDFQLLLHAYQYRMEQHQLQSQQQVTSKNGFR